MPTFSPAIPNCPCSHPRNLLTPPTPQARSLPTSVDPAAAAEAPPWRQRLLQSLASVPPTRHRHLRPFAAPTSVHLQPLPSADPLLDLASNDYLGLSRHPNVVAAAAAELTTSGLGARA